MIGDASVVVTALEVGPAATSRLSEETDDWWGARMALAHDVALTQVLAGDTVAAEKASAELVGYRTDPWSDH